MSEATMVNVFTVFRVLLVGCIFLVIPLVTRKGLLFGVYVGESVAQGNAARALVHRWYRAMLLLMALALFVGLGISQSGRSLAGDLTATAILVGGGIAFYLRLHYAARTLVPPEASRPAEVAVASLQAGEPKGAALAKVAIALTLIAAIGSVVYATVSYESMPERVPTHFGISGEPDAWSDKSITSVMVLPLMNLVVCPFIALMALLVSRAKRSVRGGSGGGSIEAQDAFRGAVANLLSGAALLTGLMMTVLSVQMVRVALDPTQTLGPGFLVIVGLMMVYMFVALIRIVIKYGQGGALMEQGSPDAPLTDGLADNEHWVAGVFYVNRDDPSIMVEKRFGIGYTINFGNRKAVVMLTTFLALLFALVALALLAGL
ncbi:MAG: DUF1648 domain-containing protein [bacterium]|nr:DUF1648 domain-containing protein [bacterium]